MYLINTSYGWNLGDDLIREGVLSLLGLVGQPSVFINRAQVRQADASAPLWRVLRNMPTPEELVRNAKAFVVAGTPEWVRQVEEFYEAALEFGLPIYLVGVGMGHDGNRNLLERCKPLIRGATVRDRFAKRFLRRAGIDARWFPDPAFHANYTPQAEKEFSLVVNYRAEGGNGVFGDGLDRYWRRVATEFASDIDLVTVHEAGEYARAAAIFDAPIFYSSDYQDYKAIYSKTARYFGGRIHGSVPVVACGGTAWLVYNTPKVDTMQRAARLGESLHILTYNQFPSNLDRCPHERMLRELENRRVQHKDYWRTRMV